ncbi:MAG: MFS transporter [Leptolyngbyaceae cyanobacterium]
MGQAERINLPKANKPTANTPAIAFIFVTIFLDLLGLGILLPVIPFLVAQFDQAALTVGLLALSYAAAQFAAAPVLGKLSDRYGRRPILLISVLGTGLSNVLFGLATTLWLLFVARLLDGITGGNISVARAYIADVSTDQNRARNFGLIGAAFGVGLVVGPAVGGWLSQFSLQMPAFVAGGMSLVTAAFGFFVLPESLPAAKRQKAPITIGDLNPLKRVGSALRRPILGQFLLANFALNFAFGGLNTNFALFTFARFGLGPDQNGNLFAYIGVVTAFTQGLIIGVLAKRFNEDRLAFLSLWLLAAGYLGLASAPNTGALYAALALISVGGGIAIPTLTSAISRQVSAQQQGAVLGAAQAIDSLALIFGPVWAGITFDSLGTGAPYWTGAIWLVLGGLLVANVLRKTKPRERLINLK